MFSLEKSEFRQLLSAVNLRSPFGPRDYILMMFLYHTGLRVGECSGLLVTHVADLDGLPRHRLHVHATISKGSRGRVIPLNSAAQLCVEKILRFNRSRGFSVAPAAPLFQHRKHGPLSVRSMQKLIQRYRVAADLDIPATPHTFRHTHASALVAAGASLPAVQRLLGHRQLVSTQIYAHVSEHDLKNAAELLAK